MKTEKPTEGARRLRSESTAWQKDPRTAGDKLAYSVKEAAEAINEIATGIQLKGTITGFQTIGTGFKKRLVGTFKDETGSIELVWFQRINWVLDKIKLNTPYIVFGKPNLFRLRILRLSPSQH